MLPLHPDPRHRTSRHPELVAGRLALDFANTLSGRGGPGPRERLGDYAALLVWGRKADLLSQAEASALAAVAAAEPPAGEALMERTRALREALVRLFLAAMEGCPPEAEPLAIFNRELAEAPPRRRLDWTEEGYAWRSETGQVTALAQPLWPLLWSAVELLAGGETDRIKICAGDDCGWLFYDASRNGTRRWCSMADCGNVAKARRHYARRRGRSKPASGKSATGAAAAGSDSS